MMYAHYGGFWPFHVLGTMIMVALWVFFIVFIVRVIKGTRGHRMWKDGFTGGASAMEILKERYAKGEITKEEFHEMKKELQ